MYNAWYTTRPRSSYTGPVIYTKSICWQHSREVETIMYRTCFIKYFIYLYIGQRFIMSISVIDDSLCLSSFTWYIIVISSGWKSIVRYRLSSHWTALDRITDNYQHWATFPTSIGSMLSRLLIWRRISLILPETGTPTSSENSIGFRCSGSTLCENGWH